MLAIVRQNNTLTDIAVMGEKVKENSSVSHNRNIGSVSLIKSRGSTVISLPQTLA